MNLSLLIPLFPMFGALIWGLLTFSKNKNVRTIVSYGAPGVVFLSFLIGLYYFIQLLGLPEAGRSIHEVIIPWIRVKPFLVNIGFQIDQLSIVMILIVTFVSFLIHVYSIGYMWEDGSFSRFFSYLNLFTAMMLILVIGDNLLLMFVGWEGVGLCSFLLIGYWYKEITNAEAGMKAFIVNRVGDFAFICGMFLMFWILGSATNNYSFDFKNINSMAQALSQQTIFGFKAVEVVAILLFIGATGKSAQIPLHVWLPDAMAGPTPVSALIHAATMVTAGVFMIGRLGDIFALAPWTLSVIAIIGVVTSFFAATIAISQNDIKKVLAYSTVSQLGYMFLAMGVGAYSAGIFHLMTHAFFKALLFLGSGSVIMGMHHEQDMRLMGGLLPRMKYTGYTFLIGVLAISGIAPLAGFFSKDEILYKTFLASYGQIGSGLYYIVYGLGLLTAMLTVIYMFRQYFMTFTGKFKGTAAHHNDHSHDDSHSHHGVSSLNDVKESPNVVVIPLVILALLTAVSGFINLPHGMGGGEWFHHWLAPIWKHGKEFTGSHSLEILLALLSLGIAVSGIGMAYLIFKKSDGFADRFIKIFPFLHKLSYNKYFVDELYQVLFVKATILLSKGVSLFDKYIVDGIVNGVGTLTTVMSNISGWIDKYIVDGLVNGISSIILAIGSRVRRIQTGYLHNYLYYAVGGVAILIILLQYL